MARVRKPQPTLENLFFSTGEQKVLRLLLSEPTSVFTPRVISSRLKGVRGLGGTEGIGRVLTQLEEIGLVEFVDNRRAVRLNDECSCVKMLKALTSLCELEGLKARLKPLSSRGILFGSRATGRSRSDSNYNLAVVGSAHEEVRKITEQHPLGRQIELLTCTDDAYTDLERVDPALFRRLSGGIVLWGSTW